MAIMGNKIVESYHRLQMLTCLILHVEATSIPAFDRHHTRPPERDEVLYMIYNHSKITRPLANALAMMPKPSTWTVIINK